MRTLTKLEDELGQDNQGCLLPSIFIKSSFNRYSGTLHKPGSLNEFDFMTGPCYLLGTKGPARNNLDF